MWPLRRLSPELLLSCMEAASLGCTGGCVLRSCLGKAQAVTAAVDTQSGLEEQDSDLSQVMLWLAAKHADVVLSVALGACLSYTWLTHINDKT